MTTEKKKYVNLKAIYGVSIKELKAKHGYSRQAFYQLHHRGRLKLFLQDPERFKMLRYHKNDTKYLREYGMKGKELMAFLGVNNHCTIYELDKAGLLHCCVDFVSQNKK